jgi:hypothetical protein
LTGSWDQTARVWETSTGKELCQLISFRDRSWAVVDSEGRFDGSNGGDVEGLHWVAGNESIGLAQLKDRYYEPGLLAKKLGFNKEALRDVRGLSEIRFYPEVEYEPPAAGSTKIKISLTNRGGGIGKVRVLVNGKEVAADARGPSPDPNAQKSEITVDLAGGAIRPGQLNTIQVLAWNGEEYLSSRGAKLVWTAEGEVRNEPPELYAIIGGISNYASPDLNLRFAAKDAEDMTSALTLAAKRLFGAEKVHISLLRTSADPSTAPTKENFRKAFEAAARARPDDILVVYLAGHGVALSGDDDVYCYPTQEARTIARESLSDPALRQRTAITSDELVEWTKEIKALKQVMILDTCEAGAAAVKLVEKRNVSANQTRAIERLKDRTGFHVMMGSAADAVSYEASRYGQGLLTYALLQGMKGAALREDEFVDISTLFQYAADQVPRLARDIGGIQRPVIAARRGTSFDVGQLKGEDKERIPLAKLRPLVLRPSLQNREEGFDTLGLERLLREHLRVKSYESVQARRGEQTSVFVDADELPGAIRPSGNYTVEGDRITVSLNLIRDRERVANFLVEGDTSDLEGLMEKIRQAMETALQRVSARGYYDLQNMIAARGRPFVHY